MVYPQAYPKENYLRRCNKYIKRIKPYFPKNYKIHSFKECSAEYLKIVKIKMKMKVVQLFKIILTSVIYCIFVILWQKNYVA